MKHAIKHCIPKPFDLLITIPLTRTKALVNNLLMSKPQYKLRIFEIVQSFKHKIKKL